MKAAVFLDRDGVINEYEKPVNHPEDLVLFPWTPAAIRRLNEEGYPVFIVTNQGGLELGYFTVQQLEAVHSRLQSLLQAEGAHIDEIIYCPHFRTTCPCRKPKPGMLLHLATKYGVDLPASWMIGDRRADILAGQAAGCQTIKIDRPDGSILDYVTADYHCRNLLEAVNYLLNPGQRGRGRALTSAASIARKGRS
jgi:histidinol-phosphate phosphatase family protein